jgi:hypothetical protein
MRSGNAIFNFKNFTKTWIFFNITNRILKTNLSKKQSENIVAGIHAFFSLFLSGTNDIKRLRWFSSAYFLHDFIQIFFSKKLNVMKLAYMYHHLSAIYLLSCDSREVPFRDMLFWGELSNLSSYPLYYLNHQNKKDRYKIRFFQILQKILYCSIRIPILTSKLLLYISVPRPKRHIAAIFPVYLMGIIWSSKILFQKPLKSPRSLQFRPVPQLDIQDTFLV